MPADGGVERERTEQIDRGEHIGFARKSYVEYRTSFLAANARAVENNLIVRTET